jgi:hypothetical protein
MTDSIKTFTTDVEMETEQVLASVSLQDGAARSG